MKQITCEKCKKLNCSAAHEESLLCVNCHAVEEHEKNLSDDNQYKPND